MNDEFESWQKAATDMTDEIEATLRSTEAKRVEREDAITNLKLLQQTVVRCKEELAQLRQAYTIEVEKPIPEYVAAVKAVEALTRADIYELKGLIDPPQGILLVLEAVIILTGYQRVQGDKIWDAARHMISQPGFKSIVAAIDKDQISPAVVHEMERCAHNDEFESSDVQTLSHAAVCLRAWVRSLDRYHSTLLSLEPKRRQIQETEAKLASQQQAVENATARISECEASLDVYKTAFEKLIRKREQTNLKAKELDNLLVLVTALMDSVKPLHERNLDQIKIVQGRRDNLLAHALLCACWIAYCGPCSPPVRLWAQSEWQQLLQSNQIPFINTNSDTQQSISSFSFAGAMVDGTLADTFLLFDLSQDCVSFESALVSKLHNQFPLIWDPQGILIKWLRAVDREFSKIELLTTENDELEDRLIIAMKIGSRVILQIETEYVPPWVEKILMDLSRCDREGAQRVVTIQQ
eukprot:jgi/Hompol1/3317/HPOL_006464-RA